MLRFLEKDPDSTFIFIYPTKVFRRISTTAENRDMSLRHWPKTNVWRSKIFFRTVQDWRASKLLPMTATRHKKSVVSASVALRGSVSNVSIGQIREKASIIFTNFVSLCCPRKILGLTTYTGHDAFFDPSS